MNLQNGVIERAQVKKTWAQKLSNATATAWFLVALVGQWIFVYYVAMFYGGSTLSGDFEQWNRVLPHGYIEGETMGNIAVGLHVLLAIIIMFGGPLQFVPQLQRRARKFHRWNGRVYLTTVVLTALDGLYMVWTRGTVGGEMNKVSISMNAVLIVLFALLTLRSAMARNFHTHQQWAFRLFLTASGVWFFRIGLMLWLLIHGEPVGFDMETFEGPFLNFLGLAQYLLPLAIYQGYLWAKKQDSSKVHIASAVLLVVFTVGTALGVFAATMGMWLPSV